MVTSYVVRLECGRGLFTVNCDTVTSDDTTRGRGWDQVPTRTRLRSRGSPSYRAFDPTLSEVRVALLLRCSI